MRKRRDAIPKGECIYFDEAYERGMQLQQLELKNLDVNMFAAVNNSLINDGCGLYRGRLILPYEHLSRFQNDLIDYVMLNSYREISMFWNISKCIQRNA